MSWWTTRYKARPASNRPGARIALDELSRDAEEMEPPRTIAKLWYAQEMNAWCALLNDIDGDVEHYIEMDELVVWDMKNNPHKYTDAADAR